MFEGKRVLVVVPARGGSQSVKLKNLREIGGVPLVAQAGRIAAELDFADRRIVSTDHAEITRVAKEAGLAAPFVRPETLSGSIISDLQVLTHALEEMERIDGLRYDIVVMLQPTSPSRTAQHVRDTVALLVREGFDAVWSVSESDSKAHPLKQLSIGDGARLDYYDPKGAAIVARQQLQPVYHRNGVAYAFTRACLLDQKTIKGTRTGALIVEGPVVNIDTELDLEWANFLMQRAKTKS
ncbi:MAG: acylneuraminate cytidylyltransferase family protein [Dongiaceae bacterium]